MGNVTMDNIHITPVFVFYARLSLWMELPHVLYCFIKLQQCTKYYMIF